MTRTLRSLRLALLGALSIPLLTCGARAAAPADESVSHEAENAVVKVFSTIRRPDIVKPWSKQAPVEASGSGVIIEGKRILTNAHVVAYASQVQVQGNGSGDKVSATVEAFAPGIDLAVLKLEDESFFNTRPALPRAKHAATGQGRGARLRLPDRRHLALDHPRHRLAHRVRLLQLPHLGAAHPDRCGPQSRQQRRTRRSPRAR